MARKKDRNHYDLKEIENYCRTKTFPKRLPRKGEQPILADRKAIFHYDWTIILYTKRAHLPLQLRIVKSTSFIISTKEQSILVTQKQCQLILGELQHTRKQLHVSFDLGFKTMLPTTCKNVIVVKDKVVCHLMKKMRIIVLQSHST